MKIHIYKGPMDKIPLNAIPFYKTDTMETYSSVLNQLKQRTELATNYYDISTMQELNFGGHKDDMFNYYTEYFGIDIANAIKKGMEIGTIYCINTSFEDCKRHLLLFTIVNEYNNLIVYDMFTEWTSINISFRGFLKQCNEKFKKMGYNSVAYHFPIAHNLKPDLSREDYDKVVRLGATDDCMGYRCYLKNFKQ